MSHEAMRNKAGTDGSRDMQPFWSALDFAPRTGTAATEVQNVPDNSRLCFLYDDARSIKYAALRMHTHAPHSSRKLASSSACETARALLCNDIYVSRRCKEEGKLCHPCHLFGLPQRRGPGITFPQSEIVESSRVSLIPL